MQVRLSHLPRDLWKRDSSSSKWQLWRPRCCTPPSLAYLLLRPPLKRPQLDLRRAYYTCVLALCVHCLMLCARRRLDRADVVSSWRWQEKWPELSPSLLPRSISFLHPVTCEHLITTHSGIQKIVLFFALSVLFLHQRSLRSSFASMLENFHCSITVSRAISNLEVESQLIFQLTVRV